MLKIFTIIICFLVVPREFNAPGKFGYEVNYVPARQIRNLTSNIVKDAYYKLLMAQVVESQYMETPGNKVGKLMGGVIESYRNMIKIYRNHSEALTFKSDNHTITEIMNAYAIIQGDYNKLIHGIETLQNFTESEDTKIKYLAKKHNIAEDLLLKMINAGVDVEGILEPHTRRKTKGTDLYDTLLDVNSVEAEASSKILRSILDDIGMEGFDFSKGRSFNAAKKNGNNTKEVEYKKSLRDKKWAEKWDVFNSNIEGVNIPDEVAKMGLKNTSDSFMNELKHVK